VIRTVGGSLCRLTGHSKAENGVDPMAVEGLANSPYAVASRRVDCVLKNTHIPVSFWRSVGSSQNAFAIESFIDEMAHATGQDPYSSGANCSPIAPISSRYSTRWPRRAAGERRCPLGPAAASP